MAYIIERRILSYDKTTPTVHFKSTGFPSARLRMTFNRLFWQKTYLFLQDDHNINKKKFWNWLCPWPFKIFMATYYQPKNSNDISTRYSLTTDFSPWLSYQICHTQSFGWDLKN